MAINVNRLTTAMPRISMTLESERFNKFIGRYIRSMSSIGGASALIKIGLDLVSSIIYKSAVDTGRSRAAWYFAANGLSNMLGQGSLYNASGAAQSEGLSLGGLKTKLFGFRKYIVISNAVEYIWPLEYGWSGQAPHGMVRISMMMVRGRIPKRVHTMLQEMWRRDGRPDRSPWRASATGPTSV